MLPAFTSDILEARRFDSQAAAEDAAHVLRIEVLGSDPKAQVFRLGDQEIHVVYAGGGQYLRVIQIERLSHDRSCATEERAGL